MGHMMHADILAFIWDIFVYSIYNIYIFLYFIYICIYMLVCQVFFPPDFEGAKKSLKT